MKIETGRGTITDRNGLKMDYDSIEFASRENDCILLHPDSIFISYTPYCFPDQDIDQAYTFQELTLKIFNQAEDQNLSYVGDFVSGGSFITDTLGRFFPSQNGYWWNGGEVNMEITNIRINDLNCTQVLADTFSVDLSALFFPIETNIDCQNDSVSISIDYNGGLILDPSEVFYYSISDADYINYYADGTFSFIDTTATLESYIFTNFTDSVLLLEVYRDLPCSAVDFIEYYISNPCYDYSNTCSDGIQNGDEAGIDCGGSSCEPCSTCNYRLINLTGFHSCEDVNEGSMEFAINYESGAESNDTVEMHILNNMGIHLQTFSFIITDSIINDTVGLFSYDVGLIQGVGLAEDFSVKYYHCGSLIKVEYFTSDCFDCSDGILNGDEAGIDCGGLYCPPCDSLTLEVPSIIFFKNGSTLDNGCKDPNTGMALAEDGIDIPLLWTSVPGADSYNIVLSSVGAMFPVLDTEISDTSYFYSCTQCYSGGNVSFKVRANIGGLYTDFVEHIGTYEPVDTDCATCSDGFQNGDEKGIDCGGSNCMPCDTILCDFTGSWQNYDDNTGWIPHFDIFNIEDSLLLNNTFGSCTPTDCNWGIAETDIMDQEDCQLTFYWDQGFSLVYDTITRIDEYTIFRSTYTIYTDGSGRINRLNSGYFYRADCYDLIKNGREVGIDCGGPFCEPCPYPNCKITDLQVSNTSCDEANGYGQATIDVHYLPRSEFEELSIHVFTLEGEVIASAGIQSDSFSQITVYGLPADGQDYYSYVEIIDYDLEISCAFSFYITMPQLCTTDSCRGDIVFDSEFCQGTIGNKVYPNAASGLSMMTFDDSKRYNISVNGVDFSDISVGYGEYLHMEDTVYTFISVPVIDTITLDTIYVLDTIVDIYFYYEHVSSAFETDLSVFGIDPTQPGVYDLFVTAVSATDSSCINMDTMLTTLEIVDFPSIDFTHSCNPDGSITIDMYYGGYGGMSSYYVDGKVYADNVEVSYIYGSLPGVVDSTSLGYFMGSMTIGSFPYGQTITIEMSDYCAGMEVYSSYSLINDCQPMGSLCDAQVYVQENCTLNGNSEFLQIYPNAPNEVWIGGSYTGSGSIFASLNALEYEVVNYSTVGVNLDDLIDISGATQGPQYIFLDYMTDGFSFCGGPNGKVLDSMIVDVIPFPQLRAEPSCDTIGNPIVNLYYEGYGGIEETTFNLEIYDANLALVYSAHGFALPDSLNMGIEEFVDSENLYELSDIDDFIIELKVCEQVVYSETFINSCQSAGDPCSIELSVDLYCVANGQYQQDFYYQGGGVPGQVVNYSIDYEITEGGAGGILTLPDTLPPSGTLLQASQWTNQNPGELFYYYFEVCPGSLTTMLLQNPCEPELELCTAQLSFGFDCFGTTTQEFYVGEDIYAALVSSNSNGPFSANINGVWQNGITPNSFFSIDQNHGVDNQTPGNYLVSLDSLVDLLDGCEYNQNAPISLTSVTVKDFPALSFVPSCSNDNSLKIQLFYAGGGIANSPFTVIVESEGNQLDSNSYYLPTTTNAIGAQLYTFSTDLLDPDQSYSVEIFHPCLGLVDTFTGTNSCKISGCIDPNAHNYNPRATTADASCETCSDGVQNGDETGVDCGGALCAPCQVLHDFTVSSPSISINPVMAGSDLTVTAVVHYQGESSSTIYPLLGYYLSTDHLWDTDDILLDDDPAAVNRNVTVSAESQTVTIPSDIDGDYFIIFKVDYTYGYAETNEDNNEIAFPVTITQLIEGDDFGISSPNLTSSTVEPGDIISASCNQTYMGTTSTTLYPRVGFYFSLDDEWDPSEDVELGDSGSTLSSSDLDDPEAATIVIPSSVDIGDGYILFVADHEDFYGELDEQNNVVAVPILIEEPEAIVQDFYVENAIVTQSGSPVSNLTGGSVYRFAADQYYSGDSPTRIWVDLGYYISEDDEFDIEEDFYIGRDPSSVQASDPPDLFDPEYINATIPNTIPSGDYFILFVADHIDEYPESDETNNVASVEVYISPPIMSPSPSIDRVPIVAMSVPSPIAGRSISTHIETSSIDQNSVEKEHNEPHRSKNSMEQVSLIEDLRLYPNPTTGIFNISWTSAVPKDMIITVYDALGRQILSIDELTSDQTTIDMSQQVKGTYHITIQYSDQLITKKMILIN